jgi:integrase
MASDVAKFIDYEPSYFRKENRNFRVGNTLFLDDVWDFKELTSGAPIHHAAKYRLNFTVFSSNSIKETVKWYAVGDLKANSLQSVRRKIASLSIFRNFLSDNPDITSFMDMTKYRLEDYFQYVLEAKSEKGESLSAISKKKSAQVVQEILVRGAVKGWEVPKISNYVRLLYDEMIIGNKTIKKGTRLGKSNKVLPEKEIISNIIKTAEKALEDPNEDVLASSSVLLSTQLGSRIEEVLTLKLGCLSSVGGKAYVTFTSTKVNKEPVEVHKPANELVVKALKRVEESTRSLRKESGLPYLFLTRHRYLKGYPVVVCSHANWNKNRLRPWMKKHDFRDVNGNFVDLTSHYFRHICATAAFDGGLTTMEVAELLGHKSILMTSTYDHSDKQQIVKDILSGETPIASTNKMVLEQLEGKNNPFKGKTIDQIEKMRRALKIELLPHGVCTHHPMRGEPCGQDSICLGCKHFIASARHLPIYKNRLYRVNEELKTCSKDNSIWSCKLKHQQVKLTDYIEALRTKMANDEYKQTMTEVAVSQNA